MATKSGQQEDRSEPLNPSKSLFIHGPSSIKQATYGEHPLKQTRPLFDEYRDMQILRSIQGTQAPLRLLAERKAASKIGRLPFLPSSNLMMDVLTGQDEMINVEDFLDNPMEFGEAQLPPHMTLERSLNIL